MSSTREEFEWYSREIATAREALKKAHSLFSELSIRVDRLERERGILFDRLMKEAEARFALTKGERR